MDLGLAGKTALVTGGARGLGQAICRDLAAEGAQVAVNYCHAERDAERLVDELGELGVRAVAVQGDVSSSHTVQRIFDSCFGQLGGLDVLVNNAGIWPQAYVHELDEAAWDRTLAVNLKGPFLTCREAVRRSPRPSTVGGS